MGDEAAAQSSSAASDGELPVAPNSPRTSVYSYASSVDRLFVIRELYGRLVTNTNEQYVIPGALAYFYDTRVRLIVAAGRLVDLEEHERLVIQHEMLKAALGGVYIRQAALAVRRALAPRKDGDLNAVLDIGCGGGVWVIDMARLYPHAEVVGMDLTPPNLLSPVPENTRFECDDANYGLSQYGAESFDVVHARCITPGITDYRSLLQEVYSILRPGGVLLTVDCDMLAYGENQQPISAMNEDEPGFSWMNRLLVAAFEGIIKRNPNADAYRHTSRWIEEMGENESCWDEFGERAVWVPLGPWTEELQGDRINGRELLAAQLMQLAFLKIGVTLRPVMLISGNSEEVVDKWIREQEAEVKAMNAKLYFKWIFNWAVKKRG